jgi:predicted MFS family arabinose efflux permease
MGVMQTFGANLLGNFAAPLVIVAMATACGWRMAFNLAGIPGLLMVAIMALVLRTPSRAAPTPTAACVAKTDAGSFRRLLGTRNIFICLIISVLMVAWMTIAWTFLPLYYVQVGGLPARTMSILMALFGISGMAVGFVVPKLSDRLGRRRAIFVSTLLGGCIPLGALLFAHAPAALGFCALVGWTASGAFPLFMATVPTESVNPRLTTRAMALVMGAGEVLGGFSGPALAGVAADASDLRAPLYILLALSTLAGTLALLLAETAPSLAGPR